MLPCRRRSSKDSGPTSPANYEIAIPALEEAAAKGGAELNKFFAEFYLARIFSDNDGGFADSARAYTPT
jgi:hypothetical protein